MMSGKIKKDLLKGSIGALIFASFLIVLFNQRGYKTPDDPKEIIPRHVDAILYGEEDPVGGDPSLYERAMIYNLLTPPEEKEETAEDKAEAERLANWKANFPYKPTTDPDVVMTEETIKFSNPDSPAGIHGYLKMFFQNEMRFTPQFEQLYHILEEHGRGGNPVATGKIFNCLWEYHHYSQKDPDERSDCTASDWEGTSPTPKKRNVALNPSCMSCTRKEGGRIGSSCRKRRLWLFETKLSTRLKGWMKFQNLSLPIKMILT